MSRKHDAVPVLALFVLLESTFPLGCQGNRGGAPMHDAEVGTARSVVPATDLASSAIPVNATATLPAAKPAPTPATPPPHCPPTPLKAGSPCKTPGECTYIDCAGAGVTTARCNGSKISVEVLPCAPFLCGGAAGRECTGGSVCVESSKGRLEARCSSNPCGKAALSCGCAASLCDGDSCAVSGRTVHCGEPCVGCP